MIFEYTHDGWRIVKEFAGGPGFKIRRFGPFWRWWAWPNENASSIDYYVVKGWARTQANAERAGRLSAGFEQ